MLTHTGTKTIRTPRLTLRRFTMNDVDAMYENWATDEKTTKYLTWNAYTEKESLAAFIAKCVSEYENPACYHWVIEYEGQIIGTINLHGIDNKSEHCEFGYCIGSKWWNRGIVTEATRAVIAYAFLELHAHKVCAKHDVQNAGSGRVMQKCGMTLEGVLREQSLRRDMTRGDFAEYGILRSEWQSKPEIYTQNGRGGGVWES